MALPKLIVEKMFYPIALYLKLSLSSKIRLIAPQLFGLGLTDRFSSSFSVDLRALCINSFNRAWALVEYFCSITKMKSPELDAVTL